MSNQPIVKRKSNWPRLLRRGLLENIAIALIGLGFLMLFQDEDVIRLSGFTTLRRCR